MWFTYTKIDIKRYFRDRFWIELTDDFLADYLSKFQDGARFYDLETFNGLIEHVRIDTKYKESGHYSYYRYGISEEYFHEVLEDLYFYFCKIATKSLIRNYVGLIGDKNSQGHANPGFWKMPSLRKFINSYESNRRNGRLVKPIYKNI